MPGAMHRGNRAQLLESQSLAAGTHNTPDFWLIDGGGLIVWIDITAIGSGVLTDVRIQARVGANYETVAAFAALAIDANGRYGFRIAAGAARAAGANAYKGAVEDAPPTTGRVQLVTTTGAITLAVKAESIG